MVGLQSDWPMLYRETQLRGPRPSKMPSCIGPAPAPMQLPRSGGRVPGVSAVVCRLKWLQVGSGDAPPVELLCRALGLPMLGHKGIVRVMGASQCSANDLEAPSRPATALICRPSTPGGDPVFVSTERTGRLSSNVGVQTSEQDDGCASSADCSTLSTHTWGARMKRGHAQGGRVMRGRAHREGD